VGNGGPGGGSGVVVVGGRQARKPSLSCESRPVLANGDISAGLHGGPPPPVPRGSRAGCGGTACTATRAIRSLFPTTSMPPVWDLHCRVEGLQPARCHLQEEFGGAVWLEHGPDHVAGPGSPPRRRTRATARPSTHTFSGGVAPFFRENPGWALLLNRHRDRSDRVGREGAKSDTNGEEKCAGGK